MNSFLNLSFLLLLLSCQAQNEEAIPNEGNLVIRPSKVEQYYLDNKGNDEESVPSGTVANGSLKNAKLVPFKGDNFQYFDTSSYLGGRAFTCDKVLKTMLDTYQEFAKVVPTKQFYIMECSNNDGGKLFPHRTHQNGLSVDFMMPLIQEGKEYSGLDQLGKNHYWLEFDNEGKYSKDKSISVDFNLIAQHILLLDKEARKNGLKVSKVIIKIEFKDELFATYYGKQLQSSGVYIVKSLSPMINALHDEHYHIDFEIL
jgi:penicillin-insensitive murein endopeptidase